MTTGMTGGHWRPCNVASVEAHNERRPEYLESVRKADLNLYFFQELTDNNSHWVNPDEKYCNKTIKEVLQDMINRYVEKIGQPPQLAEKIKLNKKTGREYKCAGWSPIREMCVPIKEDTRIDDFDFLRNWAKNYGIEIIRIDLHKDEGHREKSGKYNMNLHAHVVASFFDWQTGRTVKPNAQAMSEMQTVLAMALDMERGQRKVDTGAKYLDHQQYRNMMEEIDREKKKKEDEIKAHEKEAKKKLDNLDLEIKKAMTKIKGLTTMLSNLQSKKEQLLSQLNALDQKNAAERTRIQEQLKELDDKLQDKMHKLSEAEKLYHNLTEQNNSLEDSIAGNMQRYEEATEQLRELSFKKHDLEKSYDDLMQRKNEVLTDVLEKTQQEVDSTMWNMATQDLKQSFPRILNFIERLMTPRQYDEFKSLLDGTFLADVAQRGEEIAGVAAALFLGYIDQATTFAQNSGGGGGSAAGFGRNKDEDDESFRRRCCIMAGKMLKPAAPRRQIKR